MGESSRKWQCSGFATRSGFGACAHDGRLVRVDVAVSELHVAAVDGEAAALPEEWRSLSGKCIQWGDGRNFREMAGARVLVGFGACAHVVKRLVRVDVAGGQRDLRAGPRDIEAAALPEK